MISLNCCIAKVVWCIETLFGIANNKNFIQKRQEVRSNQSIAKITFYCGCCIFLKYAKVSRTVCLLLPRCVTWYVILRAFLRWVWRFRLFHSLHETYAMICNRLEHGLRHETDQTEMTETKISFDLADCFWCFSIDGLYRKIDTLLLQNQHMRGPWWTFCCHHQILREAV